MQITPYHVKYFGHQLTKRNPSDNVEKLGNVLQDAKVDLNPHQIEAALFAFNSPLSNGAILADEVGLGKTIEAGILLSQSWAIGQKNLLIIGPSSLRKQWTQELEEKFYLPSIILENKNFKKFQQNGKLNPFEQKKIVICSFHFAKNKADYLSQIPWDLVVIDEAHRLRNVYRPSNIIGNSIRNAISRYKKVLLTATPLQNTLMELYGLVSIIDPHVFGSAGSFRSQFTRLDGESDFAELKDRIAPICFRTLRRQVQEYVRYTSRIPLTLKFEPTPEEQSLYDKVSAYLQRELLYALPGSQRHLLTLIIRKLLASSSYAIAGTLQSLIRRLEKLVVENDREVPSIEEGLAGDIENIEEYYDEWEVSEDIEEFDLSLEELDAVKRELEELKSYYELAISIEHNAKGEQLLAAIDQGFDKLKELGAAQKTIIFTESRRTQEYLFNRLQETSYAGKVILFNGSNNNDFAKKIYKSWVQKHEGSDRISGSRTADKRQAIVDYFKDEAQIMIATEAASEGINLQFCSMLINYDLPWNPQRVEQRIGRCHRYGQQFDVVVVNFINTDNAADQRVFQLLDQKFQLFSGVFGASDEILGAVESGVDFEKSIANIYQRCRTTDQINASFDQLQKELEDQIESKMKSAREKLMENFDVEVVEKLKIRLKESKIYINQIEQWLWLITKYLLNKEAQFNEEKLRFKLVNNPFPFRVPLGTYSLNKKDEQLHRYRINHPLATGILKKATTISTPAAHVKFNLSQHPSSISVLRPFRKKKGWLTGIKAEVKSFDTTDYILLAGFTDEGVSIDSDVLHKLFNLGAFVADEVVLSKDVTEKLRDISDNQMSQLSKTLSIKDAQYFDFEVQKLSRWADDQLYIAEKELRDIKKKIRELNQQARIANNSAEQLEVQKKLRDITRKQRKKRQEIFEVEEQIEAQRDGMIDQIEKRMQRSITQKPMFALRWEIL